MLLRGSDSLCGIGFFRASAIKEKFQSALNAAIAKREEWQDNTP
jgi:hypothetical protein